MEPWGFTSLILVLCVSFSIFLLFWRKNYKGRNLPPGPTPLPIIGNMLQLSKDLSMSLCKLSEKYGSVYTVYFGSQPTVILHGYHTLKEALIEQGDIFGGRGKIPIFEEVFKGNGIVFSHGEKWKKIHQFSLKTLRNFGMAGRSIEERIQKEAQYVLKELRKTTGQPFDPSFTLECASCNVINSIISHEHCNSDNENFLSMMRLLDENFILLNSTMVQLYNHFPWIFCYFPGPHKKFLSNMKMFKKIIFDYIKKHQEILDRNNLTSYIDCFLNKIPQDQKNPDSVFNLENLAATGMNLYGSGTGVISSTLRYGLFLILKHPEIQDKIHEEIDRVIGQHRIPSLKDKLEMPYTDAVLHEIQRYINIAPFGLLHEVTCDTYFHQYFIPKVSAQYWCHRKSWAEFHVYLFSQRVYIELITTLTSFSLVGTTVIPLISSVLFDATAFPNPHQFDPGHFLNEDGSFKKSDYFVAFSMGKRACLGERLAKMELFLFLVTILQNFTLKSIDDPKEINIMPHFNGVVTSISNFKFCFCSR